MGPGVRQDDTECAAALSRQTANFTHTFNTISPFKILREKNRLVPSGKSGADSRPSRLTWGAFRDRHERWAWDAMAVSACSSRLRADEHVDADGEIVLSRHPDADAKLVAMIRWRRWPESPAHRGGHV
jgi:hypothetical protein